MLPCFRRDEVWTPAFAGVTDLGLFTDLSIIRQIFLEFRDWLLFGYWCLVIGNLSIHLAHLLKLEEEKT